MALMGCWIRRSACGLRIHLALAIFAVMVGITQAGVIYVDGSVAGGSGSGSTWANAHTNVAAALAAAVAGDDLWVAQGLYASPATLTLKPGVNVYGGFTATTEVFTARDWTTYPTLFSGAGVRRVLIGTNNTVLDGVVVTNGLVAGQSGAGLLIHGSSMTVRNCLFVNNTASGGTGYGGAIGQTGAGSAVVISNCVFRGNTASRGGAIHWATGSALINDSRFVRNTASSVAGGGGGAFYVDALTGTIADSVFVGNTATGAGGGAIYSTSRLNALATFRQCVFAGNSATGGGSGDGGVMVGADSFTLDACVFSANRASAMGGVSVGTDNATRILRSTLAGNEGGTSAGAAYYQGFSAPAPLYENCLIAGNAATLVGGALYAFTHSRFDLHHNTFIGNQAGTYGGALYHNGGTALWAVTNCVFWTNAAGTAGAQIYENVAGRITLNHSAVQGGWSGLGTNILTADPQFPDAVTGVWSATGPFDANGGQTVLIDAAATFTPDAYRGLTVNPDPSQPLQFVIASNSTDTLYVWGNALTNRAGTSVAATGDAYAIVNSRPGILSPLIDAGVPVGVSTDLTGLFRPQNDGYEIGAYETVVPTVAYTLHTSPQGLQVLVDAAVAPAPRVMVWKTNSIHTVGVESPQAGGSGTQFVFSAWSDDGAQSHPVTAVTDGASLTASFTTQVLWTASVAPVASAGNVTPANGTWYELNTVITAQAVAAEGWVFTNWSAAVAGGSPQVNVTLDQARHAIANFAPTDTVVQVVASPFGRTVTVDDTHWTTNMFSWSPGSVHTLSVAATQGVGTTRYVFTHWENGSTVPQRIFNTGTGATNLVAHFQTQYALTGLVLPEPELGQLDPPSGNFYAAGSLVPITAQAYAGVPFARWTGDLSGVNATTAVLMNGPKHVNAIFQHAPVAGVIYVDDTATGANTGANWFDAQPDLAQALAQAASGDEIWVAKGTYAGAATFAMKPGVDMVGGFAGWEGNVGERAWRANPTILDGQGARRVISATNNAVLDGFVIANGMVVGQGGGLLINNHGFTVQHCTFSNNIATGGAGYGGALAQLGASASSLVSNCVFVGNEAAWGGALYWANGRTTMLDSHFTRNRATSGGGVAYVGTIIGLSKSCSFVGNRAGANGGGVYWSGSRFTCVITNRYSVFADNGATGPGGALATTDSHVYEHCTFSANRSDSYGGVLASVDGASAFVQCVFAGNESGNPTYGGGAVYHQGTAASPTLENSVFSGNMASGPGGALQTYATANMTVRHATFAGNRSASSGGVLAGGSGTVQIHNSILWRNAAAGAGQELFEATPGSASVLYSNVRGGHPGTENIDDDPRYAGGPTGVWTDAPRFDAHAGQTALTDSANPWADGLLNGYLLNPQTNQWIQFVVASNRAGIIYVWGNAVTNRAGNLIADVGHSYQLISLQPLAESPVIDAGADFGVTKDIRGAVRPQPIGGAFDMGAYEGAYTQTVVFAAAASIVGESIGTTTVSVVINSLMHTTGSVQVAVAGGTAVPGEDYSFVPVSLTFDPFTGKHTVPVTIHDNGLEDSARTLVLGLLDPTNLLAGAVSTHTITILDDDTPVTVAFATPASSSLENVTPAQIDVTLSQAHGLPVSVQFDRTGGSATPGQDFNFAPDVLEFDVGVTGAVISVTLVENPSPEPAETVVLALSDPVNASLGTHGIHTLTILDTDFIFVDHAATGDNNGTTWQDAFTSLAAALDQSDRLDVIWVAEGTYRPAPPGASPTNRFAIRAPIQLYGGFRSGMATLEQRDPYRHVTVLSGDLNGNDLAGWGNRGDNVATVLHVSGAYGGSLLIDGFTVRGGYTPNSGAGLYLDRSGPFTVSRCTFTDNYISGASGLGAGMWCDLGATGTVRNALFFGNYSAFRAAGFGMDGFLPPYAQVNMVNCTVTANDAEGEGDGVYARASGVPVFTIKNCIIWDNGLLGAEQQNIRERGDNTVNISYSNYDRALSSGDGITDLGGQLTVDPLFADAAGGDFLLKSASGRWTPSGIVRDDVTSPCVDAGHPGDSCDDEPQAEPCRIDMGAYGGTTHAAGSVGAQPDTGLLILVQ